MAERNLRPFVSNILNHILGNYIISSLIVDLSILVGSTDGVDCVLLTQGLDDHAHTPTLKYMSTRRPDMKYIAPPSAISVLKSCGIPDNCVTVLSPGQTHILTKKKESSVPFGQNRGDTLKITATTGALVGPPWQAPENGYILQPEPTSPFDKPVSLYYEPHCMYDPAELSR